MGVVLVVVCVSRGAIVLLMFEILAGVEENRVSCPTYPNQDSFVLEIDVGDRKLLRERHDYGMLRTFSSSMQ